ncbi:hypothetical protein WOLCODRAFT_158047 [Wolfiporia cocos MD-104 SS10]|uniref:Uncharacterized protein n=1 Tax=Wolfiporia cocos (strain MD-104) TaxID=742152 RepID=A0A2H3J6Q1_WOLCO|nr:hypothetical protein WOLCODRAFT_158047 [Wolfiporia cocos MD-104 SS10]
MARRYGNDDDTGVIPAARRPPFGKEPAPVATPAVLSRSPPILRYIAKTTAPTTIRNGRHLPRLVLGHWDTATPLRFTTVIPHTSSLTTGKMGPTMPPGSSLGCCPCLADKPGTTVHVTSSAELLDGTATESMDLGETASPPPYHLFNKKISTEQEGA